jgi:hypothetical protein
VRAGDIATLFDWEDGSRPEDLAAGVGGSVYDLLMHLSPLLPRRILRVAALPQRPRRTRARLGQRAAPSSLRRGGRMRAV